MPVRNGGGSGNRRARTPVLHDADQAPVAYMLLCQVVGHEGEAAAAECGVHHRIHAVERILPAHSDFHASGASVDGILFDAQGYQATFGMSAGVLVLASALAALAARASNKAEFR